MARLIWTPGAEHDYTEAFARAGAQGDESARRFTTELAALAEHIAANPRFGAEVDDYRNPAVRERLYGRYRVIYRIDGDDVYLLLIRDAARRLPRTPG